MNEPKPSRLSPTFVAVALALGLSAGGYAVASAAGGSTSTSTSPAVTVEQQDAVTTGSQTADNGAGAYDGHKCPKDGAGTGAASGGSSGAAAPSTTQSGSVSEI